MGLFGIRRRERAKPETEASVASGPADARAYAIGDVHGRLDLLDDLLAAIDEDRRRSPAAREFLILVGDLIDRGPDSRGVIERLMARRDDDGVRTVFLMGNHEEMLLHILQNDPRQVWDWLAYGGYEFAQSYGVEVGRLRMLSAAAAAETIRDAIPPEHLAFVASFADSFRFGDYLFVHAGIRPGVPLEQQRMQDLRWIREDFLDSEKDHGAVIVHGHTIVAEPEDRPNRIGLDTGAYASGILTAVCIQDTHRKFIAARRTEPERAPEKHVAAVSVPGVDSPRGLL